MFHNSMPRYEILSSDALATLDSGWRKIVTEIGVQFAKRSEETSSRFRDEL